MFRKLISEVTLSSSLIGELGKYAQKLKQEEHLRHVSVWFTLAAVVVTTIIYLFPPSSSNTAHPNDLIHGGISSKRELLEKYSNNESDIKSIFTALGIRHGDLLNSDERTIPSSDIQYLSGRVAGAHHNDGEYSYEYKQSKGITGTVYLYPTTHPVAPANESHRAITGTSATLGDFSILLSSGNVALPQAPQSYPSSAPCSLQGANSPCRPQITFKKTAYNTTQKVDATTTPAKPRDRIAYTITATNQNDTPVSTTITDTVADIIEYTELVDTDGGTYEISTQSVSWTTPLLNPGESYSRTLSVRLRADLAASAQGSSNPSSYDCVLVNTLSDTTAVSVTCPLAKEVEAMSRDLPSAPLAVSLLGSIIVGITSTLLYIRTRIFREEVRLVRKDINSGTLL